MIQKLPTIPEANCWHNYEKQKKALDNACFDRHLGNVWPVCMDLYPRNSGSGIYYTQCRLFGRGINRICHLFQ